VIEISHLSKSYGDRPVLDDLSLNFGEVGITSLIGPNGAGKSTLLAMISRLDAPDSGQIKVDGFDVRATPSHILARRLSILRQDNAMTARLNVRELVTFGRYPHSRGRLSLEDRHHIDRALDYLELDALQDRFLDELSGGQRQRAFIAMTLCQDTDYMLLDEPLNNLDMPHAVAMMKLLRRAADDLHKIIVLVLHDINFASCYSDHIVAMREGKIVATGTPDDIMRTQCLRSIYDFDIHIEEIHGQHIAVYYN